MSNFLKPEKVLKLERLCADGSLGIRTLAKAAGVSKNTAKRYIGDFRARGIGLRCACGASAGHQGWCSVRYSRSSARQAWMDALRRQRESSFVRYPFIIQTRDTPEHELLRFVNAAVPRQLPDQMRADVCQDLAVALLSGEVSRERAPALVKKLISANWKINPSRYGPLSLDATIPGTESLRMIDTLANDCERF